MSWIRSWSCALPRSGRRLLAAAAAFALLLLPAASQTPGRTLNVPGGYATIQAAVNAAAPGDTVQVAAGTYAESVEIAGKSALALQGAGADATTVAGTGWCGVWVHGASTGIVIRGLGVRDCTASGVVCCGAGTSLALDDCDLSGNGSGAEYRGGMCVNAGATVVITRCRVHGNGCHGLSCGGSGTVCTVTASTFASNGGCGIWACTDAVVSATDTTAEGNAHSGMGVANRGRLILNRCSVLGSGEHGVSLCAGAVLEANGNTIALDFRLSCR